MEVEHNAESRAGRSKRLKEKRTCLAEIDDDIDGQWSFDLDDKLNSDKYVSKSNFYAELRGSDLNVEHFQKNGFSLPILVKEKTGLGMRIPSENFTVGDVKRCIGSRRVVDVVDVKTQKGLEMTLKEWVNYYEDVDQHKDRLLNVISLEFSHTRLEDYVDQPLVVSDLDWVNCVWPSYYKDLQSESTNELDSMLYPKVQKYCLMSVGGCYTDFHIDMGGTSVWYHILRGKKVFWFIPPTEENLTLYIKWTLSARQGDIFFGDMVKACYRITLEAGWTFFIPSGWIHAVFTPEDSLVFGGNFLHSFSMPMQIGISDVELKTHVPTKFRYPFFKELHWYVLERYVSCLMGVEHRERSEPEQRYQNGETESSEDVSIKKEFEENRDTPSKSDFAHIDTTANEIKTEVSIDITVSDNVPQTLMSDDEEVVMTSEIKVACPEVIQVKSTERNGKMGGGKTNTQDDLIDNDIVEKVTDLKSSIDLKQRRLIKLAENNGNLSTVKLTDYEREGLRSVVQWLESLPVSKRSVPKDILEPDLLLNDTRMLLNNHKYDNHDEAITGDVILKWPPRKQPKRRRPKAFIGEGSKGAAAVLAPGTRRRRRVRCRQCEPCTRPDCRECVFCLDLKKYGGPQRMKQTCVSRRCLAPMLARDSVCEICGNGDVQRSTSFADVCEDDDWSSWLLECRVCNEVVHPSCLRQQHPETTHSGVLDEDFPSSWDCCQCCERGLQGSRPRKSLTEKSYRASNECRDVSQRINKQNENLSSVTQQLLRPAINCPKPKAEDMKTNRLCGDSLKSAFGSKEYQKRDESRSCEREEVVHKKVAKVVKPKRPKSPDWSLAMDESLTSVRVNSRGREISLPRRYLL